MRAGCNASIGAGARASASQSSSCLWLLHYGSHKTGSAAPGAATDPTRDRRHRASLFTRRPHDRVSRRRPGNTHRAREGRTPRPARGPRARVDIPQAAAAMTRHVSPVVITMTLIVLAWAAIVVIIVVVMR